MKTTSKQTRMGMSYMIGGFFFMLLFLAFSHPLMGQTSKPIVIERNKDYEKKYIFLQNVASKVEYVPLETTDNSLLDDVRFLSDIRIVENHIFILIRYTLFHFDRSGHFLNSLSVAGQGPEEVLNASTLVVDHEHEQIGVMDMQKSSIVYYTYSGKFVKKETLPYEVSYAINLEDVLVCWNTDIPVNPSLYIYSPKNKETKTLSGAYSKTSGLPYRLMGVPAFSINREEVFLNSRLTADTVYAVSATAKRPAYIVLPSNDREDPRKDEKMAFPVLYFETSSWANVFLYGKNPRIVRSYMIDKKNNQIYEGCLVNIETSSPIYAYNSSQDDQIVCFYEMEFLNRCKEAGHLSGELKEILKKAEVEDNPVLLIATF